MIAMDDISSFEFYKPEEIKLQELPSISMQYFVKEVIRRISV